MQLHAIFALGLDGGEWSASRPDRTVPGKGLLVLIEQEAVYGPQSLCGTFGKGKKKTFSAISRITMLRSSSPYLFTIMTELSQLHLFQILHKMRCTYHTLRL